MSLYSQIIKTPVYVQTWTNYD